MLFSSFYLPYLSISPNLLLDLIASLFSFIFLSDLIQLYFSIHFLSPFCSLVDRIHLFSSLFSLTFFNSFSYLFPPPFLLTLSPLSPIIPLTPF
jgi:hypothetical protein